MSHRFNWKRILPGGSVIAFLLGLVCIVGCFEDSQVRQDRKVPSSSRRRPIDVDASTAENIGREALRKVGYDKIIKLSEKAGFIEQKINVNVELASNGPLVVSGFVRVFSRYAAAAAVTSQADSPLPGPADIAALGVIVIGLMDAGLLDGSLIKSFEKSIIVAGEATIPATVATNVPDSNAGPKEVFVVRGGIATPEQLQKGVAEHRAVPGLTGFSVQSAPGKSIEELAAAGQFKNAQISITTVQNLLKVGVAIVPSPGGGYHNTAVTPLPLSPQQAARISSIFQQMPNPGSAR